MDFFLKRVNFHAFNDELFLLCMTESKKTTFFAVFWSRSGSMCIFCNVKIMVANKFLICRFWAIFTCKNSQNILGGDEVLLHSMTNLAIFPFFDHYMTVLYDG
jgi:hypothetical protein